MEEKTINYRMPGKFVLLHSPSQTEGGIILAAGSKATEDFAVAKVGDKCEDTKAGDRVVIDASASLWNIDGTEYWQIHESQIVGYMLNDGKITKGIVPDYSIPDPTGHYNQNR